MRLTEDLAARFASIALGHVTREHPNAGRFFGLHRKGSSSNCVFAELLE
jgi:hypothetical protein